MNDGIEPMVSDLTSDWLQGVLPLDKQGRVLFYDGAGLLAFDKPAGVLSHPNKQSGAEKRTLLRARYLFKEEAYKVSLLEGKLQRVFLCNRLDSHTSGLLLAALTERVAEDVKERFKSREVDKQYKALCFGRLQQREGIWKNRLGRVREKGKLRVKPVKDGRLCLTRFFVEKTVKLKGQVLSLLSLKPETGLTHQLRVHCALNDVPIVGDRQYGDFAANREYTRVFGSKRLFLHAHLVCLPAINEHHQVFKAVSDLPDEFRI